MMKQQGKRLHPVWVLLRLVKFVKEILIAFVLFIIIHISTNPLIIWSVTIILVVYLACRFLSIFLYWWNYKYLFTENDLWIIEGKLMKEERYISLERIQSVQLNRTLFHRLFGLALLSVNTATAGHEASVVFEVLSYDEAKRIKEFLRPKNHHLAADTHVDKDAALSNIPSAVYAITLKEIVLAAVTSLKLFALFPLLFALYSKLDDFLSMKGFIKEIVFLYKHSLSVLILIMIFALVVSVLIGIGLTYIRLGNFRVTSDDKHIFIKKGVFSDTEFSIQKDRVQGIKLKKNILQKWLGILEVELVSAGGVGVETVEKASTLFPLITEKRAHALIPQILPAFQIDADMTKLPVKALYLKWLRPSYIWLLATLVLLYFFPAYWYVSLVLLFLIELIRLMSYLHSGYQVNKSNIWLESGAFLIELFITKRWKIDELKVKESFLQRKFAFATLEIATRAKPVHFTALSDMPKSVAMDYYCWFAGQALKGKPH